MKKLSKGILYLILVIFNGAIIAQNMNPEAAKLYNEGNELLKAENYKAAIETFDKALAIEKDYKIYYQKGVAQKKSDDLKGALESYQTSVQLKPDFEAGYNGLGGVYFATGDYEKAIVNFEKILELTKSEETKKAVQTNLALAYTRAGDNAMKQGDKAKAIEHLEKATKLNNYDAAYLALAKLYIETGQNDNAIAAAENALKYKSKISNGGPYYYMGLAYKNKGDTTKAKEMFTHALGDENYKKSVENELSALK